MADEGYVVVIVDPDELNDFKEEKEVLDNRKPKRIKKNRTKK